LRCLTPGWSASDPVASSCVGVEDNSVAIMAVVERRFLYMSFKGIGAMLSGVGSVESARPAVLPVLKFIVYCFVFFFFFFFCPVTCVVGSLKLESVLVGLVKVLSQVDPVLIHEGLVSPGFHVIRKQSCRLQVCDGCHFSVMSRISVTHF
jgi:hypothetical protein